MNLPDSFLAEEGRRRQRIGALQIQGTIREREDGNPSPIADDSRSSRSELHVALCSLSAVARGEGWMSGGTGSSVH